MLHNHAKDITFPLLLVPPAVCREIAARRMRPIWWGVLGGVVELEVLGDWGKVSKSSLFNAGGERYNLRVGVLPVLLLLVLGKEAVVVAAVVIDEIGSDNVGEDKMKAVAVAVAVVAVDVDFDVDVDVVGVVIDRVMRTILINQNQLSQLNIATKAVAANEFISGDSAI